MVENDREVDQAVTALTAEILKLAPLEEEQKALLAVTLENAFTRLALAILAQSSAMQDDRLEEAMPAVARA